MPARLPLLLLLLLMTCLGRPAGAQPTPAGRSSTRPPVKSHVSIAEQQVGRKALLVEYPWKAHRQASVEVRLVTGEKADPKGIGPLFFVADFLKGDLRMKVYRARDAVAMGSTRVPITEKEIEMEILGSRSLAGKPAVCVARETPPGDPTPGSGAVYCLLSSWALGKNLLYLDLPREYFQKAGKMHVWFLRGKKVLWTEVIDWPGYGE